MNQERIAKGVRKRHVRLMSYPVTVPRNAAQNNRGLVGLRGVLVTRSSGDQEFGRAYCDIRR